MAVNTRAIKLASPSTYGNTTNELLYAIVGALNCIGYGVAPVDDSAPFALPIPSGMAAIPADALYCIVVVEANIATVDLDKVIRFTEDNDTIPTNATGTDEGMPLGNLTVYEVKGQVNMAAFRMIGREAGLAHSVRVQYYG